MSRMDLQELLRDEPLRRREFPVCEDKIFLAHAGVSPLPRRVAEAMQQYVAAASKDHQENVLPDQAVAQTRQLAAQLIGGHESEIAFVGSTSMGLAMVAAGLPWQTGDNVVCYGDDYPANVYPWMDLQRRGVETRFVKPKTYGNITIADLERVVDQRTRLVALASVHYVSGWRLDVDAVGTWLHEQGVLFCLDGIQSFGALRASMRHVDFAAADAHKWMLGPLGAAILYVRQQHFERLHPPLIGWHTAFCPDFVAQEQIRLRPDARRYEPGSLNLVGIVGLRAALDLILGFGIEAIEARVLNLTRRIIAGATEQGFSIAGPAEGTGLSGIVSLISQRRDPAELHAQLSRDRIVTSLRRRRDGVQCLRISPHFYTRDDEIDQLLSRL